MDTLPSKYSPIDIESKWYQFWEQHNYFAPSWQSEAYCIVIPPPNVTGSLHMGHGFQHTLMDALTRYHRMCGMNTLWQPGTDHAGIATQMVVEKKLLAQGINKYDLGREKFIDKIWEWKQESGNNISQQIRRLGASLDWSREKFTLDESMSHAVQKVFIELYREKLIYRGKKLVNWDPVLKTAISDLEVINTEESGHIWEIAYPIQGSKDNIVVATTRPETLFGDVAVAVHPNDERYSSLIGKHVHLPLTDRLIPIIADEEVEQEFGTGCVKITPAHDFNDNAMGHRHNLDIINILNDDATLNSNVPEKFIGLSCIEARKLVIAELKEKNLLEKETTYTKMVPKGDRSGAIIEPYLTDQWFVDIKPLAKPAIAAVEQGDIQFYPKNWENTYFQWMNNLEDWCISRQLWWGHRIPAWYDNSGNIYVGQDENDVRQHYQLADDLELSQDTDVLDTWFSSALWPFATLGWPEQTKELETFYPTNVLVTGFDIIFFWVARMIMLSLKFVNKVPFKQVYITGLIKDSHGDKMSKSKGNILDPIDLIDGISLDKLIDKRTNSLMQPHMQERIINTTKKDFPNGIEPHGTDALRFNFCALASTGRDIKFDSDRLLGYRNFCNKLWNATRFVMLQCQHPEYVEKPIPAELTPADQWIISISQKLIQKTHQYFAEYRFDHLANTIHEFVWHEYCSWYLEMAKCHLQHKDTSEHSKYATCHTLISMLETIIKIMHPITPFITEEIYQQLKKQTKTTKATIMQSSYPIASDNCTNEEIEKDFIRLKSFIEKIRNARSELNISPKHKLDIVLQEENSNLSTFLEKYSFYVKQIANVNSIGHHQDNIKTKATIIFDGIEMHIPLDGLIDVKAELERMQKSLKKALKEQEKLSFKIHKTKFTEQAPVDIVAKEKEKLANLEQSIKKITMQIENFS